MKRLIAAALVFIFCMAPILQAHASPNISAPIAVVMCYHTGDILYNRGMHTRWIPASMTKIMTAFITYQEIEAGNLTMDTQIRVSARAAVFSTDRRVEGSSVPLPRGATITVDTLLQLLMIPSGNAAAIVLAEHISGTEAAFVERMNATAYELGIYASFTTPCGTVVQHTNAYSIATLIREFISRYPDILRITSMPNVYFNGRAFNNTNRLLSTHYYRGADGFKTGRIRAAGWGHSTTAYRDGRRVIAVVMDAPSNDARQTYSRRLLNFGFAELIRREEEKLARINIYLDEVHLPLTTSAILFDEQLLLPMYALFEPLGYEVEFHSTYHIATARTNDRSPVTLFVGRPVAFALDSFIPMDIPAQVIDEIIFVPMKFFAAATGTTAEWNKETGLLLFSSVR